MTNRNDLMTFLINFAMDHGIGVELINEDPTFPAQAVPEDQLIIVNLAWSPTTEVPFTLAHEIGHLLNHDSDRRYYQSATVHWQAEAHANRQAIQLLYRYSQAFDLTFQTPLQCCQTLGIPNELSSTVASIFWPTVKFNP